MTSIHHQKPKIKKCNALAKGSKERQINLNNLRNRGNFIHNKLADQHGKPIKVVRRGKAEPEQYISCTDCNKTLLRRNYGKHQCVNKTKATYISKRDSIIPKEGLHEK